MKKHSVKNGLTLNPPHHVGLTEAQYGPRAHLLDVLDDEGPGGTILCEVRKPIQFKRGEEFYAEELPKFLASLVEAEGEGGESGVKDFEKMGVKELKQFLESEGVEIPKGAKKPDLVALAAAVGAPDGDQGDDDPEGEGDESDDDQDDNQDDNQ